MKKNLLLASALLVSGAAMSQTVNYALENNGSGSVKTAVIRELDQASAITCQLWVKPTLWTSGVVLMGQDNLALECGPSGALVVRSGSTSAITSTSVSLNTWTQITVVIDNGTVKVFFNGIEQEVSGSLAYNLPATDSGSFVISDKFSGLIDEVRIWDTALDAADFFWYNTINKYNPNYENLIAYWKCDQEQCDNLVDYKFNYHGAFDRVSRVAVTDNDKFKYRIVSGYVPSIMRFIDRPNIDRDMFLMTNDAILLSAKVQDDGSIFPEYPDNGGVGTKVGHIAEFAGRKGVIDFKGAGSQLFCEDGRAPFDPTSSLGYGIPNTASFSTWIYIDKWEEGAEILSKYQDEDNCMVIRLGSESAKELIVDLCGTVATLPGKIETGKWHYLGVYFKPVKGELNGRTFNPLTISIDYTLYGRLGANKDVVLSGKNMTISQVPLLAETPIYIGKNFSGKMDNIMFWGSDRTGNAQSDAENEYELNAGNWNNIFLNAYWKGDDAENPGKDYQSYKSVIEYIKGYYAGHRGMKVRMGIIYPNGEGWRNVLNQKENVDRLVADSKEILKHCDGLDVDLEWHNYGVFNPVAHRLADEVMEGNRDEKIFTISQHEYSYTLDKNLIPKTDYFTMQMYGPQAFSYDYGWYENAYQKFIDYGYPEDKLLLSYGVLLVNNGEEGYKDLYEKYGYNDDNFDPNLNIWNCNGVTKYFNGVNQTKRKQEFLIDKNCLGTMYFDMANDVKVSDYKSLIRAQNDVIAANVDTLITPVDMGPSGIISGSVSKEPFSFYPNPAKDYVVIDLPSAEANQNVLCEIYSLEGVLMHRETVRNAGDKLSLMNLSQGVYLLKVSSDNQTYTGKLKIN